MTTTILLADDHRIFRDGVGPLLAAEPDLEVVAEAEDGPTALRLARELRPDVAVLDISMPGMTGLEVARELTRDGDGVLPIILSMHADRRYVVAALEAGARGYLLKDEGFAELRTAIRAVRAGRIHLGGSVNEQVVREYVDLAGTAGAAGSGGPLAVLSAREREVLQLLAEGRSTKEIASRLCLSAKTIESHRKAVMDKLGVRSIAALTKLAIRTGLTTVD